MKPELPKVNGELPKDDILSGLEKAYGGEVSGVEGENGEKPAIKTPDDLARAGSVGLEAGLANFEFGKDDNSVGASGVTSDDDSDDSDDSASATSVNTKVDLKQRPSKSVLAGTPAAAEDKDDIEKEWVNKAKKIVEQTKADPFLQERAVSRLQADYMKKRFNKDVKLPEGDK